VLEPLLSFRRRGAASARGRRTVDLKQAVATSSSDVAKKLLDADVGLLASYCPDNVNGVGVQDRAVAGATRTPDPTLVLEPTLERFRSLLSEGWSPDTAYPSTPPELNWIAGNPRGQCGVSSVWLAEVLDCEYSIRSTFCMGSVIFDEQDAENLLDHCWLEIDSESCEELILDLTCDQAQGFHRQIVFDSRAQLDQEHVHYIPRERVDVSDLPPNDPVWSRYRRLLLNMVIAMLAAYGAGFS
jgi:hypothetical protein